MDVWHRGDGVRHWIGPCNIGLTRDDRFGACPELAGHGRDLCLFQRLCVGLHRADRIGEMRNAAHVLLGPGMDRRSDAGRPVVGMVEARPVRDFGRGGGSHAGSVYLSAAGERQTDHSGAACTCQSVGISRAFLAPTPPDSWLALCGYPVMRVVGLCCLPTHFCCRKWAWRYAGRDAFVGHECSPVWVTVDAEMDAETFCAQFGSNRVHGLRMSILYRQFGFISPTATVGLLFIGSFFLILLDICAGLPFLMAVKPSERTEMSAVYSSYRDVSGILTPGAAWLILLSAPISGIFAAAGVASLLAWGIAGRLHPRLGENRMKPVKPLQKEQRILFHET